VPSDRSTTRNLPRLDVPIDAATLHALVQDNADGVVLVDDDGNVRYANPAAFAIFNARTEGDLVGQQLGIPIVAGQTNELDIPLASGSHRIVELRTADTTCRGERAHLVSLRDITDRKRAEQQLQEARAIAEATSQAAIVLDHVGDGVFLVDQQGHIELWNPAAERITGLKRSDVIGRTIDEVLPQWWKVAEKIPITTAPGTGDRRLDITTIELNGEEHTLSVAGVSFAGGVVYAFRDITEERKLESLKSDFIATASHELRTPVTAVYGALETITREDITIPPHIRRELIETARDQSQRLSNTIEDILAASHIDSGRLHIAPRHFDVVPVARSAAEELQRILPFGLELDLHLPANPVMARADAEKTRQVLANLLENAAKYSPDGGTITLAVTQHDDHAAIKVKDTGLGIATTDQRRVFEKFYRVDPNMNRGIGGTGLGLYICRELVQRMGGTINVTSRLGEGSTFTVRLPAPTSESALSAQA
jgi:PAS domain S-box-containing protein